MSEQVIPRFKPQRAPKAPKVSAASKRPGMDPQHVKNVAKLTSCLSGRWPCHPHHLRCAGGRGVGLKAPDRFCVPLTPDEHTGPKGVHSIGGAIREFEWFQSRGINCLELAADLWRARGDVEKMQLIVNAHRGAK